MNLFKNKTKKIISNFVMATFISQLMMPTALAARQAINSQDTVNYLTKNPRYVISTPNNTYYFRGFTEKENSITYDFMSEMIKNITPNLSRQKRIGTPYVESSIIRHQLTELINRPWINGQISPQEEYKVLANNAIHIASMNSNYIGKPLPYNVYHALDRDIIWPEVIRIDGVNYIYPAIYLSQRTASTAISENTIKANSIDLDFGSIKIENSALVSERGTLIRLKEDSKLSNAKLFSGTTLSLDSEGGIDSVSSELKARNVELIAQWLNNGTLTTTYNNQYGHTTHYENQAIISSTDDISISVIKDITNTGAIIQSGGKINLSAGGNVYILPALLTSNYHDDGDSYRYTINELNNLSSKIGAQNTVSILAGEQIHVVGSQITSETSTVELLANMGIYILDAEDTSSMDLYMRNSGGGFFGSKSTMEEKRHETNIVRSLIRAGNNVILKTHVGDITLRASEVEAKNDVHITSFFGSLYLQIGVEKYFLSKETTYEDALFIGNASQGLNKESAIYNSFLMGGGLHLSDNMLVSIQYGSRNANGTPIDLNTLLDDFSKVPELKWMSDLRNDPQVNWQQVNLILEQWDYEQNGLSPAAAAIIAICVAIVMPAGAGANFFSFAPNGIQAALGAAYQAGLTSIATTASTTMLGNGFDISATLKHLGSSDFIKGLAETMALAGVINVIDSTLFESPVAETQNVHSYNNGVQVTTSTSSSGLTVNQQIAQAITHATVKALVSKAIHGGETLSFDKLMLTNLANSAVSTLGKELANKIGNLAKDNQIDTSVKYISHAALGCVLGSATASINNSTTSEVGCQSGSVGAVVGEFVGEHYRDKIRELEAEVEATVSELIGKNGVIDQKDSMTQRIQAAQVKIAHLQQQGVDIARLAGGLSAFIGGLDVNIADQTAENAAKNNALWFAIPALIAALKVIDTALFVHDTLSLVAQLEGAKTEAEREQLIVDIAKQVGINAASAVVPGGKMATKLVEKLRELATKFDLKEYTRFFDGMLSQSEPSLAGFGNLHYQQTGREVMGATTVNSGGSYVGKRPFQNTGNFPTPTDPDALRLIERIKAGEDSGGHLTEQLMNIVLKDYPSHHGKYAGNKGFDGVFDMGLDSDGFLAIIDAKQMRDLSVRMARHGAGDTFQLSENWITAVVNNLKNEIPRVEKLDDGPTLVKEIRLTLAKIDQARTTGKLKTGVFTVDKKTGDIYLVPVIINNKK